MRPPSFKKAKLCIFCRYYKYHLNGKKDGCIKHNFSFNDSYEANYYNCDDFNDLKAPNFHNNCVNCCNYCKHFEEILNKCMKYDFIIPYPDYLFHNCDDYERDD